MSWINEYTKEKPCGGSREVADGSANGHARALDGSAKADGSANGHARALDGSAKAHARRPLGSIPRAGHCCARPSKDVGGQLSGWAPTPSPWA